MIVEQRPRSIIEQKMIYTSACKIACTYRSLNLGRPILKLNQKCPAV